MKRITQINRLKTSNGKILKSPLEVYCYNELTKIGIPFKYEPTTFHLIDGFTYTGVSYEMYGKGDKRAFRLIEKQRIQPIKYTPDFIGYSEKIDNEFIIETKGHKTPTFRHKWKLFKRYLMATMEKLPLLFLPQNKKEVDETIKIITNDKVNIRTTKVCKKRTKRR